MTLKILQLRAENFKRLRAVEIAPDGDVIELRGPNGAGKSSVLDAIWAALGGAREAPARPIRNGEDRALIQLDLGTLVVTRRFSGENSSLTVEQADTKARFQSPQKVLDELIGAVAMDPMVFCRLGPKDQLAELRRVVPVDADLDALDESNRADYSRRTEVNRAVTSLRAQAEGIAVPEGTPEVAVDVDALLKDMEAISFENRTIDQTIAKREKVLFDAEAQDKHALALGTEASKLREQAKQLIARADELVKQAVKSNETASALRASAEVMEIADKRDVAPVTAAIRAAQATNAAVMRRQQRAELLVKVELGERRAKELTQAIAERDTEKRLALGRAAFPVPGLAFGPEGVLLNDVPFDQASQAEKIRVSVALAMAANPKLRVLCVRDGSLLDKTSLHQLRELVKVNDYQLWLEVTDDDAATGVIIEDGSTRPAAAAHCRICKRELNQPSDPLSVDCGGDCLGCMAEAGDPDAINVVASIPKEIDAVGFGD
jgi:hypothetical protein